MIQRDFNKLGSIQAAIDTLRMYNNYVLFPATEEVLQNPALEAYYNSPLDDPIERKVEKILCAAVVRTVYNNPDIPQNNKEQAARATARGFRAALQISKLEYYASTHEMKVNDYNRRKRGNYIVKKATKIKMAKTFVKNITITALAGVVAGPIGASVAVGTRILSHFLPDKIKEPIQQGAREVKEAALNTLENTVEYIKSTRVGEVVQKAIDVVKPTIKKVYDTGKKIYSKLKAKIFSMW